MYTFHPRDGVVINTGEPVNAGDVIASYQRRIDNPTLAAVTSSWPNLANVEKIDDLTMAITLTEPYGSAL